MELALHIDIPDSANISATDAQIMLAAKLYEAGKLSLGQAARTAGLSYRTFYELLIRYKQPVFSVTEEELKEDIENAARLQRPHNS
jgi:predicted HTH domain antitoxin